MSLKRVKVSVFTIKKNIFSFSKNGENGRKKIQKLELKVYSVVDLVSVDIIWTGERERLVKLIERLSDTYDGEFSDVEVMNALNLKKTTYYTLKREVKLYRDD